MKMQARSLTSLTDEVRCLIGLAAGQDESGGGVTHSLAQLGSDSGVLSTFGKNLRQLTFVAQHGATTTTTHNDKQRSPHGLVLRHGQVGLGRTNRLPQRVRRRALDEVDTREGVVGDSSVRSGVVLPRNVVGRARNGAALLVELCSADSQLVAQERSLVSLDLLRDILVLHVHSLCVRLVQVTVMNPDDGGSDIGVVAELDDEAKSETVVGATEEGEEDVLSKPGSEGGGHTTEATVDEDGDIGVTPGEHIADEMRVHRGTVSSEDAVKGSRRCGGGRRSDQCSIGSRVYQRVVADIGHCPGNDNELGAKLLGVIGDGVRVSLLANDGDMGLNVNSAEATELTEKLQGVVGKQKLILLGGLHDGERTTGELNELESVDVNSFAGVGDSHGWRGREARVAVRVGSRQLSLTLGDVTLLAFRLGRRSRDLGGNTRVHGVGDRFKHLRDEHGRREVLNALKDDEKARSVFATARRTSRRAKEGVPRGLIPGPVAIRASLSIVLRFRAQPLMVALGIDGESARGRDNRQEDGNEDKHREQLLIDDTHLQTNVEHNQLDETLTRHEHTNSSRFAPGVTAKLGDASAAKELADESDDSEEDDVAPNLARVQGCQVGVESGQHEVDWKEEHGDQIINSLRDGNRKTALVGDDETSEEATKNGVHADDARDEGRREHDQKRDSHDHWCRAVLQGATATDEPVVSLANRPEQNDRPADGTEENVDRVHSAAGGSEREGQGEENPAHDIVADASSQDDDSNLGVEELGGRQDTTKHRESGNGHRDTDEEDKVTEFVGLIREVVIDGHSNSGTQTERDDHSSDRDQRRVASVALHDGRVDLETNDEEEQHETDRRHQVQIRDRLLREDVLREAWDATKGRGAQEDTSNDLGDDFRLLDPFETPSKALREGDDDEELDDEERDGLGTVSRLSYAWTYV